MAAAAKYSPFQSHLPREVFNSRTRKRNGCVKVSVKKEKLSESGAKRANLSAGKKERIKIPNRSYGVNGGSGSYSISEFFSHPSGIEALLNTRALQSYQSLDSNLYRCVLPQIQLLNFRVAPVLDLQVTPSSEDCLVEMLSCKAGFLCCLYNQHYISKYFSSVSFFGQLVDEHSSKQFFWPDNAEFEGSEVVERQNEHFSASMKNHITWETIDTEQFLNVDVKLNLVLEIYTQPFALLPVSAVEGPGNIMMQTLVDKLVPLLVQQLLQNYEEWILQQQILIP